MLWRQFYNFKLSTKELRTENFGELPEWANCTLISIMLAGL
jgi:hypothetical protein